MIIEDSHTKNRPVYRISKKRGCNYLRWFFAIPFVFLGVFLMSLTIDNMGNVGHMIMKMIGFGCFFFAGFIVKNKKILS